MDDTASRKSDLEIEGFSLIDVSSEDDCLLNSPHCDLVYNPFQEVKKEDRVLEFLDTMYDRSDETSVCSFEEREEVMKLHESPEVGNALNNEKYNLRKSLAWDNAFFTSAGVLDPEELCSIIEGNKKGEKHRLNGIQEDMHRSIESVTTLGSDNLTIESLEADLFEDIRASIQKSSNALTISNYKKESGLTESATTSSSNKADLVRSKMKHKAAPKKPSVCIQGSGKTVKQASVRPQVSQSAATRGNSTQATGKPPKLLGRVNPTSTTLTKRASLDVNWVKTGREMKSAMGRGAILSKKPASISGRNILPRPSPPAKSPLCSSAAVKTDLRTSCSSLDSCSSASSSSVDKSSLTLMKKKNDSRSSNPSFSGSASRTPSRSKSQPSNSHLSTSLMSMTKPSSSTSPSSSISEWSSESSAVSAVNQRASLETLSCKKDSVEHSSPHILNLQDHANNTFFGDDDRVSRVLGGSAKRVSTGTGQVIQPPSMKPSGLRMPSPKIGFFDAVRSVGHTSNGNMQPRSSGPGGLPKPGSGGLSRSGNSIITRPGKLQSSITLTSVKSMKPDSHQTTVNVKPGPPLSPQESSNSSKRFASRHVKIISSSSPKIQNRMFPKTTGGKSLMPEEEKPKGADKVVHNQDIGFTEKSEAPTSMNDESLGRNLTPYVKDIKMVSVSDKLENSGVKGSISNTQNLSSTRKGVKGGNTEKKVHFADEVDKLTRKVEAVDIIKTESEKEPIIDSPSLCMPKEQVLDSPLKPTLPQSPLACDTVNGKRMPLAVNNSSHDREGMLDTLTVVAVEEVENTAA